jgi:phage baseplate assembly protein W
MSESDLFQDTPEPEPGDDSFLPPDDDPIPDPDEELDGLEDDEAERFIDSDEAPDVVVLDEPPPPLGLSWAFSFEAHTFLRGGLSGPLETRGLATLRGWIEKCLQTERGQHPIHPPDYGLERPDILGEPVGDEAAADLEEAVRDALLFHPRITDVTEFEVYMGEVDSSDDPNLIVSDDEALYVSFTVVTDDEETIDFTGVPMRGS